MLPNDGPALIDGVLDVAASSVMFFSIHSVWISLLGATLLLAGEARNRALSRHPGRACGRGRLALAMPVRNEDPARAFAGLAATWQDLQHSAAAARTSVFILSDTTDREIARSERAALGRLETLCPDVRDWTLVARKERVGGKAGNVEDFLRERRGQFEYVIILDADSVMSGNAIAKLLAHMDRHPDAGIVQAGLKPVRGRSLFARLHQFGAELSQPLIAAATSFWTLGEGNYWGHNAIVRVEPFLDHCHLSPLSGAPPFGGGILSHDIVEAAFMRRAGWRVLIAPDVDASFEEVPPSFADFMRRDRRWCQGNAQFIRVAFAPGLHWVSRFHLVSGFMKYAGAPVWLLLLSVALANAAGAASDPAGEMAQASRDALVAMLVVFCSPLIASRALGVALFCLGRHPAGSVADRPRVLLDAALELLGSLALAPVRLVGHAGFFVALLFGRTVTWQPQRRRAGTEPAIAAWLAGLGPLVASGLLLAGSPASGISPSLPVLLGFLSLALVLALVGGSERIGSFCHQRGFFLTKEEVGPVAPLPLVDAYAAGLADPSDAGRSRPALQVDRRTRRAG